MFSSRTFAAGIAITLLAGVALAQEPREGHLMRLADVSDRQIVFTYEDDLWIVPIEGGLARRLTNDPGVETWAKFSPDGRQIAFTAQYDGGTDVYVMPAEGGVPRRLTYHPGTDRVLGWWPDGKSVYFRSSREYPLRGEITYRVPVDGGPTEKLAVDRAGLASVSPDGGMIAYDRISREAATWKRYRGGMAQDIWMGRLDTHDYRIISDTDWTSNFPMWHGDAVYFSSDREDGTLNLYRYDVKDGTTTRLTQYKDYDIKYPSIGPRHIVYQYAESLHLYDLASGKAERVPVTIPSDLVRMRPELVPVAPSTGAFGLSPAGVRMVLEARGEILNYPAKDGEPYNLTRAPGSREKNAVWSPSGRWVAFLSDRTGEEELYLVDQKGEKEWKQLTRGGLGFRMHLVWSPDSKHLLFSDKFMRLNLCDAQTGTISVLDQADYDDGWEWWGIQDYAWSPDSRWIAYTKMGQSLNTSIFLHSLDRKQSHRLTSDRFHDFSPCFDPEGKYLYFLSDRTFNPVMCHLDQNHAFLNMARPYLVLLQADAVSPFMPKDSEEAIKDDAAAAGSKPKKDEAKSTDEKAKKDEAVKPVRIDLDGIERRVVAAEGVEGGDYFRLEAVKGGFLYLQKTKPEFSKYTVVTDQTEGEHDLYKYDLEKKEASKVLPGIANYHLSADGKKLVYRAGARYGVVDAGPSAKVGDGEVKLGGIKMEVARSAEFMQMFNEAWRIQRDWFYDPGMHGLDWKAVGEQYRRFVPFCGTRGDLNYLIGEMIAELNIGHTYVYGGDLESGGRRVSTGLLGAEFAIEPGARYYRIARIIPGTPGNPDERSPLDEPGCPVKAGNYLIAVDGQEVGTSSEVYEYLQNKADKVVRLTYNDKPSAVGAKTCRVKTIGSENAIRYREWVEKNRAYVDKMTNGQVGYLHIPDMGEPGLVEFAQAWYAQYYKKGMIIDERYNAGGFTGDMIVDRLERSVWSVTKPREGRPQPNPERCFMGPWCVLINEDTGSNGEFFAQAIQYRKLAPVIGMRTWGGATGIEAHQDLVDGGTVTPPQFGMYGLDRTWPIEGRGVEPDVEVQNMPGDVLTGKDAQLDAGIENLLNRIKQNPVELPEPGPYPKKAKPIGS
jgi:tricorn protease